MSVNTKEKEDLVTQQTKVLGLKHLIFNSSEELTKTHLQNLTKVLQRNMNETNSSLLQTSTQPN